MTKRKAKILKLNTMFDNLKETIENNEEMKYADKGSNFLCNLTSESEDEDFKMKKIEIKKRLSATSVKSMSKYKNTRGKETERSCDDTKNSKVVKRKKLTKRTNKQTTEDKVAVVNLVNIDLVDERMREAFREEINTSVEVAHPIHLNADETEPIIQEMPQMEQIHDNESIDTLVLKIHYKNTERKYGNEFNSSSQKYVIKTQMETQDSASNDTVISKKKVSKNTKKIIATFKKEKGINKNYKTILLPDNDDRTSSALPDLVAEVESKPKCKDDNNEFLMLQMFKEIFRDGPDVNDSEITQNMLLDVEKINKNRETLPIPTKIVKNIAKKKTDAATVAVVENIEIASVNSSDNSIATYSITAHGDDDEVPPATETLIENFQHRELPDLDRSMKDYFIKLTQEICNSSKSRTSRKSAETQKVGAHKSGKVSPVVLIKRLSFEDLSKWMPSRRTSFTDSPNTISIPLKKISETSRSQPSVEAVTKAAVNDKTSTPDSVKHKQQNKHKKHKKRPREPKKNQSKRDAKPLRKSPVKKSTIISPIKLFDDFVPNLESEDSTDNESVPKIYKTISKAIENKYSLMSTLKSKIETPVSNSRKRRSTSPILTVSKKRNIESEQRFHKSKYRIHGSQQIMNESQSSEKPKKNVIEPQTLFDPRIDVLEDVTITESGPGSSSVNDWFKRTDSAAYRDASTSVRDTIQNVMEKLDTTLVEMNQNTSRKFVNLFVEAQKELDLLSEQIAKSQVILNSFSEKFKEKAFELIQADCLQKRTMVALLKDDAKAAMDHIEKGERD